MDDITLRFMIQRMNGIITDDTDIFVRGVDSPECESRLLAYGKWFEDSILEHADEPVLFFSYFADNGRLHISLRGKCAS